MLAVLSFNQLKKIWKEFKNKKQINLRNQLFETLEQTTIYFWLNYLI